MPWVETILDPDSGQKITFDAETEEELDQLVQAWCEPIDDTYLE